MTDRGTEGLAAMAEQAECSHRGLAANLGLLDVTQVRSALQELTTAARLELAGTADTAVG